MAAAGKNPDDLFSLDSYHVSEELGFILPEPLKELPPYYQPWMDIALRVPELLETHQLRDHINNMPQLSSSVLQKHRELRLAHLALGVMTMGYVWEGRDKDTVEVLPKSLAVPYWEVSQRLGLPPILTHADIVLANWKRKDPDGPFDIKNLELLLTFPGDDSTQGFFLVTLLVELAAVPALKNIPTVINSVRSRDPEALTRALDVISQSLQDMTDALKLMHDYVNPNVFYGVIRIFLSGWKDNPLMPNGLIYEGIQTGAMKFSGGSAAQSSLFHCFDELLGVHHVESNGAFLQDMRNYMPPVHKKLIQDISLQPSLRDFVQQQACDKLSLAFHQCVTQVTNFRTFHIIAVTRFITVPAARARQLHSQSPHEKSIISKAPIGLQNRGTGGSGIMNFLKTVRDETKGAFLQAAQSKDKV